MKKILLILFFTIFLSFSGESEMIAYMKKYNNKLSEKEAKNIYKNVVYYSNEYDVDPILVFSVIKTESNFRHSTESSAGAKGLMQLMPINFDEFQVDNSVEGNIKGGIKHLKRDYDNTQDITKTLVCYNAGCGRLRNNEWKKIRETRNYIEKINNTYPEIKSVYYTNIENSYVFKSIETSLITLKEIKMLADTKDENFIENEEGFYLVEAYI